MTKLLKKIKDATRKSDYYWKKVRYIPKNLAGWDINDQLKGDEVFGHPKEYESAWGLQFDVGFEFDKLKVESKFKAYVKEYTKKELVGKLHQEELLKDHDKIAKLGGVNVYIWTNKLNKD